MKITKTITITITIIIIIIGGKKKKQKQTFGLRFTLICLGNFLLIFWVIILILYNNHHKKKITYQHPISNQHFKKKGARINYD
jgi:multisubunit Na+/H+ antiporter MnhB subunit